MRLLWGPEARTSQLVFRRRLRSGHNFDILCNADLGDPDTQRKVVHYIRDNEVLIVVMAHSYRSIGPPSNLNYSINPVAWAQSYNADLPHLQFCGAVARDQARRKRFWFAETSFPTWLWTLLGWPWIKTHAL